IVPGAVTSSGWTLATDRTNLLVRTAVLWRVATASDPASWQFSAPSGTTTTGALSAYRGVDTSSSPIAVTATGAAVLATSHPLPQVTTPGDAEELVHVVGIT